MADKMELGFLALQPFFGLFFDRKGMARQQSRESSLVQEGLALRVGGHYRYFVSVPHRRKPAIIVSKLLEWYPKNARDLPWRRTKDPYAIWVSEIMLQQTQVDTVIPYWTRWMQSLPTVQSAAAAKSDTLHKLWEGLGYYSRVRNLQKAAREIVTRHGGRFPKTFEEVLALPGIGPYTAGAICSIAFNQPQPILDGNVMRVLTRILGLRKNPRETETNRRLWRFAGQLVNEAAIHPGRSCSLLNQALMELGALVCTPRNPRCGACPLSKLCAAHYRKLTAVIPNLSPRPASTRRRFAAFIVERRGRLLLRQRPDGVVNARLWELPNIEKNGARLGVTALAKRELGTQPADVEWLCTVRHSITRYRIQLDAYRVKLKGNAITTAGTWIPRKRAARLAFASAHRKVLAAWDSGLIIPQPG